MRHRDGEVAAVASDGRRRTSTSASAQAMVRERRGAPTGVQSSTAGSRTGVNRVGWIAMTGLLEGKLALVAGVANRRSIAWAVAQELAAQGAKLAFTYQGARIESSVRELAASIGSDLCVECDVDGRREPRPRVRRGERGARRARPARPLDRVRAGARSRGPLHRHEARGLPARAQRLELLARRDDAPRRAADARARRRRRSSR